MNLPTYVLHYEKYDTMYNQTMHEMVDFLELPHRGDKIEFIRGKEYLEYYTPEERRKIRDAVKKLALSITWENLVHYFNE